MGDDITIPPPLEFCVVCGYELYDPHVCVDWRGDPKDDELEEDRFRLGLTGNE